MLAVLDNIAMAKSGPGQAAVTVQPSLFDMFYEEFLTQFMSAAADPNEISQAELQTKLREDFTITEKDPIRAFSWLKALELSLSVLPFHHSP